MNLIKLKRLKTTLPLDAVGLDWAQDITTSDAVRAWLVPGLSAVMVTTTHGTAFVPMQQVEVAEAADKIGEEAFTPRGPGRPRKAEAVA